MALKSKVWGITCIVFMLLLATACSSGNLTSKPADTAASEGGNGNDKEPAVISFENHGANKNEIFAKVVKLFNESQNEVKVEFTTNTGDWQTQLKTKIEAGTAPDIVTHISGSNIPIYADAGLLQDLTGEDFLNKLDRESLSYMSYQGKVYGIPLTTEMYGIFYNKDLFEKAGIRDVPKTYAELQSAVDQIQALPDVSPFIGAYKNQATIEWWLSKGASSILAGLVKEGTMKDDFTFNVPEIKSAFEVFDLIRNNTQPKAVDADYAAQYALFVSGAAAMLPQGNWSVEQIRELNPAFEVGFFPFPISNDPADSVFPVNYNLGLNVMSSTKNMDAVRKFLDFMLNADGPAKIYYETGGVPTAVTLNNKQISVDPMMNLAMDYLNDGKTVRDGTTTVPIGFGVEVGRVMQEYVTSGLTAEETIGKLDAALKDTIGQLNK